MLKKSSKLHPIIVKYRTKSEDKTAKREGQWTGQRRGQMTGQVQILRPDRGQDRKRDSGHEIGQGRT